MTDQPVLWPKEGRSQPIMIGRDSAGRPIPGGPYTIYQLGAVLITVLVGLATKDIWGDSQPEIGRLVFIAAAAVIAGFAAARIDFTHHNPVWSLLGAIRGAVSSIVNPVGTRTKPAARLIGSAWKPEKPMTLPTRPLQILAVVDDAGPETAAPKPEPVPEPKAAAAPELTPREPRKPIQRLLAHRKTAQVDQTPIKTPGHVPTLEATASTASPTPTRQSGLEAFLAAAERSHP